jgi:hypothetical protein
MKGQSGGRTTDGKKASVVDRNVKRKNAPGCRHGRWTGRKARVVDRNVDRKKG